MQLLDDIDQGGVIQSANGTIISVNRTCQQILGFSSAELIGQKLSDPSWSFVYEDGSPFAEDQNPFRIPPHPDRSVRQKIVGLMNRQKMGCRWIKVTVRPETPDDPADPCRYITILADVSDHKQLKHKFVQREHEIQVFHSLSDEINTVEMNIDSLCQRIVDVFQVGWQYHANASMKIVLDGKTYFSASFHETPWVQTAPIRVKGNIIGSLEIFLNEEDPQKNEETFLSEVRFLIDSLAGLIERTAYQKLTEEILLKIAENYKLVSENTSDIIWVMDVRTRKFTYVSPSIQKICGYSPFEVAQLSLAHLLPFKSFTFVENRINHILNKESGGVTNTFQPLQTDVICKDGGTVPTETTISLVYGNEAWPHIIGITRDITERKRSEETLQNSLQTTQAILNAITESVLLIDKNGVVLSINRTGAERLNATPDEVAGKDIFEFVPPEIRKSRKIWLNVAFSGAAPILYTGDASDHLYQVNCYPIKKSNGKANFCVVYATDITEKNRTEIQKQQFIDDLQLINNLNNTILQGENLKNIASLIEDKIKQVFSAKGLALYLVSEDGKMLETSSLSFSGSVDKAVEKITGRSLPMESIPIGMDGVYGRVLLGKKGQITSNQADILARIREKVQINGSLLYTTESLDSLIQKINDAIGIHSVISLPLYSGDLPLGLLEISSEDIFSQNEFNRLETIGAQIAATLLFKQTEQRIKSANQRFEQLANNIPEIFWIKDQQLDEYIYISPAYETVWQKKLDDLYQEAKNNDDSYLPEDRPLLAKAHDDEECGIPTDLTYRIVRQDGSMRWIHERSFPVYDAKGKFIRTSGVCNDVTSSVLAQNKIKESESFLRSILNSAPGNIFIVDREGNFLFRNKPWASETEEEFRRKNIRNLAHPSQSAQIFELFQKSIETKAVQQAEILKIIENGEYRWHSIIFSPVLVDNEVGSVTVFAFDIHEHRQAEIALHETEEIRQVLLEAVTESILLIAPDGKGILSNTTALNRLNITEEQFKNNIIFDLLPSEIRAFRKSHVDIVKETRKPIQFEDSQAGQHTISYLNPLLDKNGNVTAIAISGFDITELRNAEDEVQRLSHIVEQTADTVMMTDVEGVIEYVNPAFEAITGYSLNEVVGKSPSFLKTGYESEQFYKDMDRTIRSGQVFKGELRRRKKNGGVFIEYKSITPMKNDQGQIIHYIEIGKDITERVRAEQQLRVSEHRNKAIVDAIPDLLFRVKYDGTFIDYHAKSKNDLYAPPEVFIGRRLTELLPGEIADPCMLAIQKSFNEKTMQYFEYALEIQGEILRYEGRIVANPEEDEAVAIIRDVTAQRQMEVELRESEENYRRLSIELEQRVKERTAEVQDLYDSAPTGYHSLDINGTFHLINQTELKWLGYQRDEVIGKMKFRDILSPECVQRHEKNFAQLIIRGRYDNIEYDLLRKDGSTFPVILNSIAVYDENGTFLHSRTTVFDNTERKAIEAEIRHINQLSSTAFELAKAGYWYIPLDGTGYYFPSDRVIEIHGDEPHADHRYKVDAEWIANIEAADPDLAAKVRLALHEIETGNWELFDEEFPYKSPKDGRIIWIHAIGNVIKDTQGKPVGLSGVTQDVSLQKELETALNNAREAAESANRAKSSFLANMSHEIRTPLNAILGFTQIMFNDRQLTEKNRKFTEIINRSGEHLLTLINEILEMSKIEAGHVTFNPGLFHLPTLVRDIHNMFLPKLASKSISIDLVMDTDISSYIITDENKLKEILINILGNAVKFTQQGGVTIRCRTEKDPSDADPLNLILKIDVQDTGEGISADEMPYLFQPFEQTRSGTRLFDGTGLGLSISQSHARLLGGEITVESIPGQGTCFHIHLRVRKGEKGPLTAVPSQRQIIALKHHMSEIKILIADDNEENRLVIQEYLEPVGIQTRSVENGEKAVDEAFSWKPALILMDLRMPGMDGFEAARRIKAKDETKNIHIIALTATALALDERKLLENGITGYLRKPFKNYELFSLLEAKLGPVFIYSNRDISRDFETGSEEVLLTSSDLKTLPAELVQQLQTATLNANIDELLSLIRETCTFSPVIADKLSKLADDYQYDTLLQLFEDRINGS